ncbi:MAG: hypothetical protein GF388_01345, partial [Candidatus Aegiribacteria sp.]|nr:hypothetical protein [Candidatus Aegiribacteria sp.]MBD3294023.1 hypothetical protein [Candidatus Fermentibacteria bacterium]
MRTCRVFGCGMICLLTAAGVCLGNGGPMDAAGVVSTGGMQFRQMEDVKLLSEDLTFIVDGEFVDVIAVYRLKNNGEDIRITYAFPVDITTYYYDADEVSWVTNYIPFFRIYRNWVPLETSSSMEPEEIAVTGFD